MELAEYKLELLKRPMKLELMKTLYWKFPSASKPVWFVHSHYDYSTPAEYLRGDSLFSIISDFFINIVIMYIFFDNNIQGLLRDCMMANNTREIWNVDEII